MSYVPPPEHCVVDNAQLDPGVTVYRVTPGGSVDTHVYCQPHWQSLGMEILNTSLDSISSVTVVKDMTYNPNM